MYTVYAIASLEHKYVYVGLISEVIQRLGRHNKGYEKTTKPYTPYILVYKEEMETRLEARNREKFLKSRSGKRFLYKLIRSNFKELQQYQE